MSIASSPPITMELLLDSEHRGRFELVNGQLEEVIVSSESSIIAMRLSIILGTFIRANQLGELLGADGYYRCFGEDGLNGRKPDASFIRKDRLPADLFEQGYFTIPPDLAVEVLSPNDLAYAVAAKIEEYLSGGVKLIWIVNPALRQIDIHRADGTTQKLHHHQTLSGEDVVSGFSCLVSEIFPMR
jgi:Uma2 family endonuclease